MGLNIIQKILRNHIVEGDLNGDGEIAIRIDQTLTQDATGTMAYLQLESLDIPKVLTEVSVSYVDHNTLQEGFENADDHLYLQTVAAKYGVHYSRAGNGVCHQVHLERFGEPGKTLLGSDSHTPTGGGLGMFAVGAGGLDVAVAMAGGPFWLSVPKVTKINLNGRLSEWVSAKDVILKVLSLLTTKGNVGTVLEYGGEGVATLSVPERATITNMGAELGVTTSVFPSDDVTRDFLEAEGRCACWTPICADPGAKYVHVIDIDLAKLVPLVAKPHSPDAITTVADLAGLTVDQVCIGSCTNSSYQDMMKVAGILKGRKVHSATSLVVSTGSRQVLTMLAQNGALADIVAAGARIMESTCGFCIGNGQAPRTDAVSVRTNNRNFFGRSGTKSANIYLVSPEVAAACALTGHMIDPRELSVPYPQVVAPEQFLIDDSMIVEPGKVRDIEVYRGPNIGDPPATSLLGDHFKAVASIKVGDKITTDHIMPAGSRLKYRSNIPKYAEFVFESIDPTFAERALGFREMSVGNVIVGGHSYGQGSSREHAAICPMFLGVRAVIAKSFERIHAQNLINFGILPLVFLDDADYDPIEQGDMLEISLIDKAIATGCAVEVRLCQKDIRFQVRLNALEKQREVLKAGGKLRYISSQAQK